MTIMAACSLGGFLHDDVRGRSRTSFDHEPVHVFARKLHTLDERVRLPKRRR